jgi:enoyl-CoA hydratase/carnithine racemase
MSDSVLFEQRGQLAVVTLNVEKTLNSLTLEMVDAMYPQLLAWQADDSVAAVFIQGAGEKALCAGGDVQQLYQSSIATPGGPCEYAETFFCNEYRLDYLLHSYSKPVICWGHGIVMGGGLGVMAAAGHKVVTERTRIAMPEITIALFPDVGGSYFLNRMPANSGLFVALTAASLNAADALYLNLGDYYCNHASKAEVLSQLEALDWAQERQSRDDQISALLGAMQGDELPAGNVEANADLIERCCNADSVEAVAENIAALDSDDKWLQKAKASLAHGSPITAKVIFEQLRGAQGLGLAEVFQRELVLATNIVRHPEFAEGVRALLIDKDQSPAWIYKSIAEVPSSLIEEFFTAPWAENPLADLNQE